MKLHSFPGYWSRFETIFLLAIPAVAAVAGLCGYQVNP
jgi:hypothetical protein